MAPARGILRAAAFAVALAVLAGCGGATSTPAVPPTARVQPTAQPTATAQPTTTAQPTAPAEPTAEPTAAVQPTEQPTATAEPTAASTAASTPRPSAEPTLFGTILGVVPEGTPSFGYTNWAQIKADAGVPDLGSRSPMAERIAFLSVFGRQRAAGSSFGLSQFRLLADTWGFDSTDLEWEATIDGGDRAPAYVLQFPQSFDLAPIMALFEERGFTRTDRAGGRVYAHDMNLSADWLIGLLAVTNVAVRQTEHSLVLSSSSDSLDRVLDVLEGTAPSVAANPVNAGLAALGSPEAALVLPAPGACDLLTVEPRTGLSPAPGLRYDAFAVVYLATAEGPRGRIVFAYATPAAAAADLALREQGAREGRSARSGRPFAEYDFTVTDAAVDGSSVVLDVIPGEGAPVRLFQVVWNRDLTFAACAPA